MSRAMDRHLQHHVRIVSMADQGENEASRGKAPQGVSPYNNGDVFLVFDRAKLVIPPSRLLLRRERRLVDKALGRWTTTAPRHADSNGARVAQALAHGLFLNVEDGPSAAADDRPSCVGWSVDGDLALLEGVRDGFGS